MGLQQNGGVVAFDGVSSAIEWRTASASTTAALQDNTNVPDGW